MQLLVELGAPLRHFQCTLSTLIQSSFVSAAIHQKLTHFEVSVKGSDHQWSHLILCFGLFDVSASLEKLFDDLVFSKVDCNVEEREVGFVVVLVWMDVLRLYQLRQFAQVSA